MLILSGLLARVPRARVLAARALVLAARALMPAARTLEEEARIRWAWLAESGRRQRLRENTVRAPGDSRCQDQNRCGRADRFPDRAAAGPISRTRIRRSRRYARGRTLLRP